MATGGEASARLTTNETSESSDELHHWICCDDDYLALCGTVTDGVIDPSCKPNCTSCNVLLELDNVVFADAEHCLVCPRNVRREP